MSAVPQPDRVLAALERVEHKIDVLALEWRALALETRASIAVVRNDVQDVRRSLGTLINSIADFRW